MSENSLEIRNKFINKINNKIKDLNENITLLAKVDNKIFKNSQYGGNINRQTGGDDDDDPGVNANKKLAKLMKNVGVQPDLKEISSYIDNIKDKLSKLYKTIDALEKAFGTNTNKKYLDVIMKNIEEAKEAGDNDPGVLGGVDFTILDFMRKEYRVDPNNFKLKYNGDNYKEIINKIIKDALSRNVIADSPLDNLHLRYTEDTYAEELQEIDIELQEMAAAKAAKAPKAPKAAASSLLPITPPTNPAGSTKYLRGFF